jgi:putative membrane protein
MHSWHMGWTGFSWLILIALILLALFRVAGSNDKLRRASAERVLKNRYARGEISREEYESMLNELRR